MAKSLDHFGHPLHVDLTIKSILHAMKIFVVMFRQVASQFVDCFFVHWWDPIGLVVNPVAVFMVDSSLAEVSFLNTHQLR